MRAYKSHISKPIISDQKKFNIRLSELRIKVDHAFAIHANSWQLFTKKNIMKICFSLAAAHYLVAVLLSNITNCLQGNQTSKQLNIAPSILDEYLHMDHDLDKEESNDNEDF